MAQKPVTFNNFWKELKRRKVVHAATVYAAIAFTILQIVNMIARPLQLPEWTEAFVIVLLLIGFILTVFISWIYDITPSGLKKTKPVRELKQGEKTTNKVSARWKIATYISCAVIIVIVGLNLLRNRTYNAVISKFEKSIVVLPFVNDSPDSTNLYLCNGMMDDILTQLQKIGDLKVKSRISGERYRSPGKDIKEIGRDLRVSYIMEGSVRKVENKLRVTVQVINAKTGNHVWAETYDGKYSTAIFEFQSNVAKRVAISLKAAITPKESKRIDIRPTADILAYDFSQRGWEMAKNWLHNIQDSLSLILARNLFNRALEIDPEYIDAWTGRVWIYRSLGNYDSVKICCKKMMEINPESPASYLAMSNMYMDFNQIDSTALYLQKAIELVPNEPWNNELMGEFLSFYKNDVPEGLKYFQKAYDLGLDTDPEINQLIGEAFVQIGDYKKGLEYFKKALTLKVECDYIVKYSLCLLFQGKFNNAHGFLDSICSITPCGERCDIIRFFIYTTQKNFSRAEEFYNKVFKVNLRPNENDSIYIAYLFRETGRKKQATTILHSLIDADRKRQSDPNTSTYLLRIITLRLAAEYAMLDDKKETLKYLSELEKSWLVELPCSVRTFPGFDDLRDNREFNTILNNIAEKKAFLRVRVREMELRGELNL